MRRLLVHSCLWSLLLCLLYAGGPAPAYADANDDQSRALFEAGIAASRRLRWAEAQELFERSLALVEKPSTLLNLAIAQVNLGRGRQALASLERLDAIADPIANAAVLERARALLAEARASALSAAQSELYVELPLQGEAAELLTLGVAAYAEGHYAEALERFERAQGLSQRPELHYNVGLAADRAEADGRALLAYEAFSAAMPQDPRTLALAPRLDALRRIVRGEDRPSPGPATESAPAPASVRPGPPTVAANASPSATRDAALFMPRALLVGGATAGIAAVAASVWWATRLDAADRCDKRADLCTNAADIRRQGSAALAVSLVLDAATVGLLVAGGVILRRRKHESSPLRTWLRVTPSGLQLGLDHF